MKTKYKNIRHYLPATQLNYSDMMFNYIRKETNEELYLGEHLIINHGTTPSNTLWYSTKSLNVYFKRELILTIYQTSDFHDTNDQNTYGQHKIYGIVFEHDKALEFKTNKFDSFYEKERLYMLENFLYEYMCITQILNQLRNYVIRVLDLPDIQRITKYDWDYHAAVDLYADKTHKELSIYLRDARDQGIGLLEKSEIENGDELKVIEITKDYEH